MDTLDAQSLNDQQWRHFNTQKDVLKLAEVNISRTGSTVHQSSNKSLSMLDGYFAGPPSGVYGPYQLTDADRRNIGAGLSFLPVTAPLGAVLSITGSENGWDMALSMATMIPVVKAGQIVGRVGNTVGKAIPKGFKETKKFGYQHGQKVYEYKGKYYSRDVGSGNGRGSHNGGEWKVFEQRNGKLHRMGTADGNLNIFKK